LWLQNPSILICFFLIYSLKATKVSFFAFISLYLGFRAFYFFPLFKILLLELLLVIKLNLLSSYLFQVAYFCCSFLWAYRILFHTYWIIFSSILYIFLCIFKAFAYTYFKFRPVIFVEIIFPMRLILARDWG
jgi:hypothetical protein